eukprot:5147936-Amphidinium_carterae.1
MCFNKGTSTWATTRSAGQSLQHKYPEQPSILKSTVPTKQNPKVERNSEAHPNIKKHKAN